MTTQKIQNIINHYKKWRKENSDTWIEHCRNQKNIEEAIGFVALAENHEGKRNGHQRRLKKINLEKFAANLLDKKNEIQTATSFGELIEIVVKCRVKGIGELACNDTAERIGAKIRLSPDKVYLHAGTRKGAEKILGRFIKKPHLDRGELPMPFNDNDLINAEIEDILCIYKDRFDSWTGS
ncbi:MAG TPA: hypothetical protein VKZ51_13570 [Cyclobacteriaceae bacterium]|nr:hypothetical protein [Cyclobacteriaceae bacterium]